MLNHRGLRLPPQSRCKLWRQSVAVMRIEPSSMGLLLPLQLPCCLSLQANSYHTAFKGFYNGQQRWSWSKASLDMFRSTTSPAAPLHTTMEALTCRRSEDAKMPADQPVSWEGDGIPFLCPVRGCWLTHWACRPWHTPANTEIGRQAVPGPTVQGLSLVSTKPTRAVLSP